MMTVIIVVEFVQDQMRVLISKDMNHSVCLTDVKHAPDYHSGNHHSGNAASS